MIQHLKTHQRYYAYRCPKLTCLQEFRNTPELAAHAKRHEKECVQREDGLYRCKVCPFTFKRASELLRHMDKHSPEKKYECQICHKKFAQKGGLQIHEIQHYSGALTAKEQRRKISWEETKKRRNLKQQESRRLRRKT